MMFISSFNFLHDQYVFFSKYNFPSFALYCFRNDGNVHSVGFYSILLYSIGSGQQDRSDVLSVSKLNEPPGG